VLSIRSPFHLFARPGSFVAFDSRRPDSHGIRAAQPCEFRDRGRPSRAASILTLILFVAAAASSGTNEWSPTVGPNGGWVGGVAVAPSHPEKLFVANGGQIFRSTDGGSSWRWLSTAPGRVGSGLAVSPARPDLLFCSGDAVSRSTDGGLSWARKGTSLPYFYPWPFVFDSQDADVIYTVSAGWSGNVYGSFDGGDTWRVVGTVPVSLSTIAIDPAHPATLYAGGWERLYKSTDSGRTWFRSDSGIVFNDYRSFVSSVWIDPASPSFLLAATGLDGIFRSTNGGATWSDASQGLDAGLDCPGNDFYDFARWVQALAGDPASSSRVFAQTGAGLYVSTNRGSSWAPASPLPETYWSSGLAVVAGPPTRVFLVDLSKGLFVSSDDGMTWTPSNTGLQFTTVGDIIFNPLDPSIAYAAAVSGRGYWEGAGVYRSTDAGVSWTDSSLGLPVEVLSLGIAPSDPTRLYAGVYNDGVYRSTDSGGNWSRVSAGLPGNGLYSCDGIPATDSVVTLAVDPANPMLVYAGTGSSGPYKSTDGGTSWFPANTGVACCASQSQVIAIDSTNPLRLWLTMSSRLYSSVDGAATWVRNDSSYSSCGSMEARSLALDPNDSSTIWISTYGGACRSTDGGLNWTRFDGGLEGKWGNSISVGPAGEVSIGTVDGPYRFDGAIWRPWNPSLAGRSILVVRQHPTDHDFFLSGVLGGGVYSYRYALLSASSLSPASGPASGGTRVSISGAGFSPSARVEFGGHTASLTGAGEPSFITVSTPPHAPGRVDVTIVDPDGQIAVLVDAFEFQALGIALNPGRLLLPTRSSATLTAVLSGAQPTATIVAIASTSAVIARPPISFSISASATSGAFSITSGLETGSASIRATLPEITGGSEASVDVFVYDPALVTLFVSKTPGTPGEARLEWYGGQPDVPFAWKVWRASTPSFADASVIQQIAAPSRTTSDPQPASPIWYYRVQ